MGSALGRSTTAATGGCDDEDETDVQAQELGSWRSNQCFGGNTYSTYCSSVMSITAAPKKSTASDKMAPRSMEPADRSCWWRRRRRSLLLAARPSAKVRPVSSSEEEGSIELGNPKTTGTAPASPATLERNKAPWCGDDIIREEQGGNVAAEAEKGAGCLGRLLILYSGCLDKHPVITKSVSSGIIGLLGDMTAQLIEWGFGGAPVPWSGLHAVWRSCAVMIDGFFINGPLLHYAYELLENFMPAEENMLSAVMQVGVDVFVIDPIFAFIFVWSTGLIEGRSVQGEILHTIMYDYPNLVLWLVIIGLCWAPLQVYLFNKYPVQFRVLFADLIDLVWTCVTSFFCHAR